MAKNVFIKIRSTPEEKSNWNKKASELGISLSELIRKSFGGVKTISNENKKIDPELIRQVAMIGNNLNQIARWANSYKDNAEALQVILHLKAIRESVDRIKDSSDAH